MNPRTKILIGVLALLGIGSVASWIALYPSQEVAPGFAESKRSFVCPHCNKSFELTAKEVQDELRSAGGVWCPACGEMIDKQDAVTQETGPEVHLPEEPPQDAPVMSKTTGMKRVGG